MNDRLKTIVDLKKYPIQDLNSPIIKNLVKKCKEELDQYSCSTIPNFILPNSLIDFISNNPKIVRIFGLRSFGESLHHSITDGSLEFGYQSN